MNPQVIAGDVIATSSTGVKLGEIAPCAENQHSSTCSMVIFADFSLTGVTGLLGSRMIREISRPERTAAGMQAANAKCAPEFGTFALLLHNCRNELFRTRTGTQGGYPLRFGKETRPSHDSISARILSEPRMERRKQPSGTDQSALPPTRNDSPVSH